jgi:hypothetical protein
MPDLSFSSTNEVKNFVRASMHQPSLNNNKLYRINIDNGFHVEGKDILKDKLTLPHNTQVVIFRSLFNPVDYDGSFMRSMSNHY